MFLFEIYELRIIILIEGVFSSKTNKNLNNESFYEIEQCWLEYISMLIKIHFSNVPYTTIFINW